MISSLRQDLSHLSIVPHQSGMEFCRVMPEPHMQLSLTYRTGSPEASVPSYRALRRRMDKYVKDGATSIVFYGSDPLCRSDLKDILQYASEGCNLETHLVTDALLFDKKLLFSCEPYLDHLYLSLDADNESSSSLLRPPHQFSQTLLTLHDLSKSSIILNVSTLLTSLNRSTIIGVARLIADVADVWRLYRYFPYYSSTGEVVTTSFVTNEEFHRVVEACETALRSSSVQFEVYDDEQTACRDHMALVV